MNVTGKSKLDLSGFLPREIADLALTQQLIPSIAKDAPLLQKIELAAKQVPTHHALHCADARAMPFIGKRPAKSS